MHENSVCMCVYICMNAYVKETDNPYSLSVPLACRFFLQCALYCHTNVFISLVYYSIGIIFLF